MSPGILSLDEGKTIQKVIDMFTQIGYICDIDVHDAQEFGVPQRRRRVFVTCVRLEDLLKKKTSISDRIILELLAQAWQSTWDASLPALCHVKSRLVSESRIEERAAFLQKKMDLLNTLLGASAVTRLLDYWGDPQVLFTEHPILELTSLQSREQPTVDLKMDTGGLPNKEATKECGYKNTAVLWQNVLDAISGIQNQSTTSTLTAETMETVISSFAEALLTTLLSIVNSPTHFFQENWSSDYWNLASLLLTLTKGVTAYAGSASCELFSSHSVRDSWGYCSSYHNPSRTSLSDILETGRVPEKYFLSRRGLQHGILRRAEKRGKALPDALKEALESVARPTPLTETEEDSLTLQEPLLEVAEKEDGNTMTEQGHLFLNGQQK